MASLTGGTFKGPTLRPFSDPFSFFFFVLILDSSGACMMDLAICLEPSADFVTSQRVDFQISCFSTHLLKSGVSQRSKQ